MEISSKVAAVLNEIVSEVRQVDELIAEVSSASREQAQGIVQINLAIGQVDKVTQSNAASSEETAAAAQELNAQALEMKQSVIELEMLVSGAAAATAPEIQTYRPAAKPAKSPAKRHLNGNGHTQVPKPVASRRQEIPLDENFRNF